MNSAHGTGHITSMDFYRQAKTDVRHSSVKQLPVPTAVKTAPLAPACSSVGEQAFSNLDRWKGTLGIPGGGRQ